MALKNADHNLKYIRVREGKFFIGKDKDTPFDELEGLITGLRYKDEEYDGSPQRKLIITLKDGDETFQIGLNTDSQNYSTFVSFLKNVDINEKITLHPKLEKGTNKDGKEFTKNSLLISQDGTFAKGYFVKDNMHGAPQWKQVKVGKKNVTDKSEYLAFLEDFVENNYIAKLKGQGNKVVSNDDEDTEQSEPATTAADKEKLPWED